MSNTEPRTYAITGVSNGIGAALAKQLKADGHTIIGLDIVEPTEPMDRFIRLDLGDGDAIAEAVSQIDEPLDGLCNCAGLPPRGDNAKLLLLVNYLNLRLFTQHCAPLLRNGASIVNLASRAGHEWPQAIDQIKRLSEVTDADGLAAWLEVENIDPVRAYCLSKEALIVWTMANAEWAVKRGLRMNCVSPSAVGTGILDDFSNAFGERMARNVEKAGRVGEPQEIAELVAFLLSPQSHWIKGVDVAIDGGMGAFGATAKLGLEHLTLPN